ncbi:MAG TPA: 2-oxo-4-hydroxy-4-carboxy-5-ureidoimidazoline decarboxylase [Steroidobacteraceae bacterium]|nr:2-oxo-4-hydroxy-4-carboxy-5-ureidoimidazoline decarboxylase [Steroidobacteraceae bacterium]
MTAAMPTALVNGMDRADFAARFGAVYEHSPWVAEGAWEARPFADRAALEQAMRDVVLGAGRDRQLALLRAHPRLGTRLELSGHSRAEQSGAGIASASEADRETLARLNRAYEEKFGFPFILAVRNASVPTILDSCRTRIDHDAPSEFEESLRQVFRIAHFRLSDLVHQEDPTYR